ncbi:hypothetical protein ACQEVB_17205 [Pseudonocardia sp. CA-107938]|uniref:hypothetical protein n=1 Tax=Pseudonocardia sp. CA-107938 TaxID=3240021 RepID=UPI003D943BB3
MWRSERLAAAVARIEAELDSAWAELRAELPGTDAELADLVLQDTSEHPWRLVDAALARSTCTACGGQLGAGPRGCAPCDLADGFRFAAVEVDRPGVPRGNEHAIRVSSAVARTRDRYTPRARVGYELLLPDLVDGALPTTPEAQAVKALINRLTPEQCDQVRTIDEVKRLASP